MRAVVQRVACASVEIGGRVTAKSERGLLIFLGVGQDDVSPGGSPAAVRARSRPTDLLAATPGTVHAAMLAEKVADLRIFPDTDGKSNLSLRDMGGTALVVSQFTLYADCRRGRRPSFTDAADPAPAEALVEEFCQALEALGIPTARGQFGAHMTVSLVNDGPYTILLDTETLSRSRSRRGTSGRN